MKTSTALVLACIVAAASAYAPMATRAVGKKAAAKAAPAAPAAPPSSGGYPSWATAAQKIKFGGISGGGNKARPPVFLPPDFSNPDLQKERDPAFYAAAALERKRKQKGSEYVFDDGLTDLERKQKVTIPTFLTGQARYTGEVEAPRDDIQLEEFAFGLSADRFQLLFIAVFGLLTLVGGLSGNLNF